MTKASIIVLALTAPFMTALASAQLAPDLSEKVSKATGFVLRPGVGSGTAVCVDKRGLFITCNHVVIDDFFCGDSVKLILNSGLDNQKELKATLINRSVEHDLALLWVEDAQGLSVVDLANDKVLSKGAAVTSFGFPFGEARSRTFRHPTLVVKRGEISNLRRQVEGMNVIQFLAYLDPGESGGPIVGDDGKLVGIVQSGIRLSALGGLTSVSTGESFGVAPRYVRELLEKPTVILSSASSLDYKTHNRPIEFTFKQIDTWSKLNIDDLTPVLILPDGGGGSRQVNMKVSGGELTAKAVPLFGVTDSIEVHLSARYAKYPQRGGSADLANAKLTVGGRTVALSDIKRIDQSLSPRVYTTDGRLLIGKIAGMDTKERFLFDNERLTLAQADHIEVRMSGRPPRDVPVSVELRRGKGVVSKIDSHLTLTNVPDLLQSTQPPPLQAEKSIVLPGKMTRVAYGGDGRFVLAMIENMNLLIVCDMDAGSIVRLIEIDPKSTLFAAGRSTFFIVDTAKGTIDRWNFKSLEKELSSPLPSDEVPKLVAMGHNSVTPLYIVTQKRTIAINTATLKPLPLEGMEELGVGDRTEIGIWPSSDGLHCGIAGVPGMSAMLHLQLDKNRVHVRQVSQVLPIAKREFLRVHDSGRFTSVGCAIVQPPASRPQTDGIANRSRRIPIDDTNLCMSVAGQGDGLAMIDIRSMQNDDVVLELPRLPELDFVETNDGVLGIMMDQRLFWSPGSARFVTIATDNQRIFIRRLDLKEEIARRKSDFFYVKTVPATDAKPKTIYRHQIAVDASRRMAEFSLGVPTGVKPWLPTDAIDSENFAYEAPQGVTVSKTGLVTWNVPDSVPAEGVRLRVFIKDVDGNVIVLPYRLMPPLGERVLKTTVTVPANRNKSNPVISVLQLRKGDTVQFTKPSGRWHGGRQPAGAPGGPSAQTFLGDRSGWMRLEMIIDGQSEILPREVPYTAKTDCVLKFYCNDPTPDDNTGEMRFEATVTPVKP